MNHARTSRKGEVFIIYLKVFSIKYPATGYFRLYAIRGNTRNGTIYSASNLILTPFLPSSYLVLVGYLCIDTKKTRTWHVLEEV